LLKNSQEKGGIKAAPYLILKIPTAGLEFNLNFYVENVRKEVVSEFKGVKILIVTA